MRRVIAIAVAGASLAGCSSFSLDFLQVDAAAGKGRAGIDTAGRRCDDLDRTGLQDPLLDRRARARRRLLRDLRDAQVPAGHGPGRR